jgi:hypothetical protein
MSRPVLCNQTPKTFFEDVWPVTRNSSAMVSTVNLPRR